jgi:hypothetical protein
MAIIRKTLKSKDTGLDKRINKTEMKFWAVLGSRGCHKYATFWGQKTILNLKKNILKSIKAKNISKNC